ncbi:hypothetical protein N658DRAFT_527908 [Parathielavia hyrcaniae]|uniref:Uncharacterized protein n=1 Tax=Parathielavia hyrcaniae TaxID=113614 RepID=A0AAN6SX36_9PEZI|nr:hypothetical protein N658DRAFT_527908 [Parathielavia hyrcaniae]
MRLASTLILSLAGLGLASPVPRPVEEAVKNLDARSADASAPAVRRRGEVEAWGSAPGVEGGAVVEYDLSAPLVDKRKVPASPEIRAGLPSFPATNAPAVGPRPIAPAGPQLPRPGIFHKITFGALKRSGNGEAELETGDVTSEVNAPINPVIDIN